MSRDPQSEGQARRLAGPAAWLLAIGAALALPGLVLVVLGDEWVFHLGLVLAVLGSIPLFAGLAMMFSGAVERRSGREKPFA